MCVFICTHTHPGIVKSIQIWMGNSWVAIFLNFILSKNYKLLT